MRTFTTFFVVAVASIGCSSPSSSDGTPGLIGSCNNENPAGATPPIRMCSEFRGSADASTLSPRCAGSLKGTWSTSACPTGKRVGGCRFVSGSNEETTWFYDDVTVDSVKAGCAEANQTYVAP